MLRLMGIVSVRQYHPVYSKKPLQRETFRPSFYDNPQRQRDKKNNSPWFNTWDPLYLDERVEKQSGGI